ncbi:MAG: ATP synthase F1 subunit epsilon [Planctomycetia bacterium]|jgi:F-type H+-transporting ATPase subunit epsilon|nr:ATP synthase F1 subunit epsilon [Planctomycetia bacterium]
MAESITCTVVTPEQTALETKADFIALPLFDGEIGIAANHSPLIGRLGYGEMRIKSGGQTLAYYVDGGFVQVADNVVAVLTSRAVPAKSLDPAAADAQLQSALQQPANSPETSKIRDRKIAQARAQIRTARRARL